MLHRWAADDPGRRFGDLFNLVHDPAFLRHAWERVSRNVGARTPGIDRATVVWIEAVIGVEDFLGQLRDALKSGGFRLVEVRQVMIPKASGKVRKLGIPTVADRVVQAALKQVLEPIFEADFKPCSYGFRPNRRSLVKAFLKSGVMTADGNREETWTGTPQGGILSPLLANIALSALDDHFDRQWHEEMGTRRAAERTAPPAGTSTDHEDIARRRAPRARDGLRLRPSTGHCRGVHRPCP
ncbi:hypothetical protein GCM10010517_16230 [Streptosporangium fragile]|uniref:Reverse transcriptase domain-containing protein n=2 Tax=Streptosporangium fragile TaxID=46186 RepID=A0ABP6I970_9ACTN